VLAAGLCWCASVIALTRWLVCLICGNRKLQADEGIPDPPAWTAVVQRLQVLMNGSIAAARCTSMQEPLEKFDTVGQLSKSSPLGGAT
jgi:hypothetical protein